MWHVLPIWRHPSHSKSMDCDWLKLPQLKMCAVVLLWYDCLYSKGEENRIRGSAGKLKTVLLKVQGHGLLQM